MDKLTLNGRSRMIHVTPQSEVLCQASGSVTLRERNARTSLDKLSLDDSGVLMSTEMQPNTINIREVSESVQSIGSTNAETGCRVLTEDITSCSKMHSEHTALCASEKTPLLPLGVVKVSGPPPASKSASRLPTDLLSRVTELVRQNPDLSQDAVGQTGRGKRVREYEENRMKRRRAVECHSVGVSGGPISTSSSAPGSVHSSPLLSQCDDALDVKPDVKRRQGEKVRGNRQPDGADTASACVPSLACNADQVHPVSSDSTTESTTIHFKDIAAFADTDKSVHTDGA